MFKNTISTIQNSRITMKNIKEALEEIDAVLSKELDGAGYIYDSSKDLKISLLNPEERLQETEKRKSMISQHPEISIPDFVSLAHDILNNFFIKYCFGTLHECSMSISYNAHFNVSLFTSIFRSGDTADNIEKIKSLGFELEQKKGSLRFELIDSDHNKRLIESLLEPRGAKLFQYEVTNNSIRKIQFRFNIPSLVNFIVEDETVAPKYKLEDAMKNLTKIIFFLKEAQNSPENLYSLSFLAEVTFADICDAVGVNGIIHERVKAREQAQKEMNKKSYLEGQELGIILFKKLKEDSSYISNIATRLYDNLSKYFFNILNFKVLDLKINELGTALTLSWFCDIDDYVMINDEDLFKSEEDLKEISKKFDTAGEKYDFLLLNNDHNLQVLSKELYDIGFSIEDISINITPRISSADTGIISNIKNIRVFTQSLTKFTEK